MQINSRRAPQLCRAPALGRAGRSMCTVRDRESYEFALASAAIGLDLHGGAVRAARIAIAKGRIEKLLA